MHQHVKHSFLTSQYLLILRAKNICLTLQAQQSSVFCPIKWPLILDKVLWLAYQLNYFTFKLI